MRKQQLGRCASLAILLAAAAFAAQVREPAVAGAFYPADAGELRKMVDALLARQPASTVQDPIIALIAPHAGYPYSGAVAARAYALLKGRKPERVVVIAPSHVEPFSFASVYDGDAYATPLGAVPVDKAFAAKLAAADRRIRLSSRGHAPVGGRGEHAIEVHLPFLQRVLGDFQLVPVVMGSHGYADCRALGTAIAKLAAGSDTLIVASTDLSHYHPYDEAVKLDRKVLAAIQDWDYLSMSRNFESRVWEACGGAPVVAAMIAAERMGANKAVLLAYANSGDVTKDRMRVVGYGALALTKSPAARAAAPPFTLAQSDREELLRLARISVETAVREGKLYDYKGTASEPLMQERGAFVTLKQKGVMRGCVGYPAPMKPLSYTVRDVAALAAVHDRRFPPVTPVELGRLQYEISVLSPFRRVLNVEEIRVGRDGLVIRRGDAEGLLLPQVPVEQGWDRNTFLEQACLKAGLPPRAWRDEETDIFSFTAFVFSDEPAGVAGK
ncbi:MAG TPA: AmmeMemoRadiSam system protein B [Bryobacteraceae bacterium]|nr:AmmeMemoRadiSam system protein B [Bryobacteraceae bacterium]HOQ45791.1 AmmeMemoRadiSam system protein B [Bryobacteraceae bacterium]HPQ14463.1 AmmeMemoRadiSam system protein B [Bryobacteraceae bacterium]HPU71000.1 AmmeMemoRadiSam system protein B [Bryobacteraceae bacterium]